MQRNDSTRRPRLCSETVVLRSRTPCKYFRWSSDSRFFGLFQPNQLRLRNISVSFISCVAKSKCNEFLFLLSHGPHTPHTLTHTRASARAIQFSFFENTCYCIYLGDARFVIFLLFKHFFHTCNSIKVECTAHKTTHSSTTEISTKVFDLMYSTQNSTANWTAKFDFAWLNRWNWICRQWKVLFFPWALSSSTKYFLFYYYFSSHWSHSDKSSCPIAVRMWRESPHWQFGHWVRRMKH